MGGYRSLKRVLGESNLERKCRWLFGICVGGLIVIAFCSVYWVSKDLIEATAQSKGSDLVRYELFNLHWQYWTKTDERDEKLGEDQRRVIADQNRDLAHGLEPARILALEPVARKWKIELSTVHLPANRAERDVLAELQRQAEAEYLAAPPPPEAARPATPSPPAGPARRDLLEAGIAEAERAESQSVFALVHDPAHDRYNYFEVVHWSNSCLVCHEGMYGAFDQTASAAASGAFDPASRPFRVVRVTMPDTETRSALNRTTAILLAVGILTVFLAMVALYYVVKYIVIKPLGHLRDVSDAVARGDLDQRAEIHTNDEFEDLAASFNKMLAHLVETQGELRHANTELDHKVDELARLNMQLHEMNRLKGEFLANMSHELRTPLNSIIGFSEVLQSLDALNDKQKRYAQTIHKSGRDLLEMINDILDLAKLEAGKMEVRLSEFKIESVIANQCDLVRQMAEDKNIDLRIEIENDLPLLYQDQAKVQQILTNLLSNAIKFTPEGGRITVGARGSARGQIEFWVSDTGVGIPAAEKEIIFEKFRQGKAVLGRDNLTREYSGTGLGLSIVKELCKLLGGEVTVESELGKGSTFRVLIPWMRTDTAAAAKLASRLDDLTRPRRLESLRGEPATAEVASAAGPG